MVLSTGINEKGIQIDFMVSRGLLQCSQVLFIVISIAWLSSKNSVNNHNHINDHIVLQRANNSTTTIVLEYHNRKAFLRFDHYHHNLHQNGKVVQILMSGFGIIAVLCQSPVTIFI